MWVFGCLLHFLSPKSAWRNYYVSHMFVDPIYVSNRSMRKGGVIYFVTILAPKLVAWRLISCLYGSIFLDVYSIMRARSYCCFLVREGRLDVSEIGLIYLRISAPCGTSPDVTIVQPAKHFALFSVSNCRGDR